jgi:hypothetical protein
MKNSRLEGAVSQPSGQIPNAEVSECDDMIHMCNYGWGVTGGALNPPCDQNAYGDACAAQRDIILLSIIAECQDAFERLNGWNSHD